MRGPNRLDGSALLAALGFGEPRELLDDLGDDAGADGTAAFADGEA